MKLLNLGYWRFIDSAVILHQKFTELFVNRDSRRDAREFLAFIPHDRNSAGPFFSFTL